MRSGDESADLLGKTLIPNEERDYYQNYFTKKYDKVRRDDVSDWKDSDGNWCYSKGYEIQWKPSDDELMVSQQYPQELLEDMSTKELNCISLFGKLRVFGYILHLIIMLRC